jgi:RNA polymerase sigma-70 factor (ECF subfamily)
MARDARAFERLYVEHEPELYRYLARRLGPTKAEEAVAEAFAVAWRGFPEVDSSLALRTWLLGLAVDYVRTRRDDELEYLGVLPPHRPSAVGSALAELDPVDRDMLTLRVWAGLSDESIAEVTQLPLDAVGRRIRAAHDHVRRRATAPDPARSAPGNRVAHRGNHT